MGKVFIVGPLPPPTHGLSNVTFAVAEASRKVHETTVFDVSPSNGTLFGQAKILLTFIRSLYLQKPSSVYIALSGGKRQWIDLIYALSTRLFCISLLVHHHSFSYLTKQSISSAILFAITRSERHIFLCGCMRNLAIEKYGKLSSSPYILSNSAFISDVPLTAKSRTLIDRPVVVGFLSNISVEKGIEDFFSVFANEGVPKGISGLIAGPVAESYKEEFFRKLALSKNVSYVGPVYGEDKIKFLFSLDILFFPTRYVNEAEPVTIWEAASHGVPVIAYSRGCIRERLTEGLGVVVGLPELDSGLEEFYAAVNLLAGGPDALKIASAKAYESFESSRSVNKLLLQNILESIF